MSELASMETPFSEISAQIMQYLGVDEDVVERLVALQEQNALLGHSIDTSVSIPITDGKGNYMSEKITSVGLTIKGTAKITAPQDDSTWTVTVADTVQDKTVFNQSGVKYGQPVTIAPYKTAWHCQLKVTAVCSNSQENTTLVVALSLSY